MLGEFPTKLISLPIKINIKGLRPGFYKIEGFQFKKNTPVLPFRKNGTHYIDGPISGVY